MTITSFFSHKSFITGLTNGIFSFLLPGLGQLYMGRVFTGIIYGTLVALGTFLVPWAGFIVHVIQTLDAAFYPWEDTDSKEKITLGFFFLLLNSILIYRIYF